jgi:hypothetical protein
MLGSIKLDWSRPVWAKRPYFQNSQSKKGWRHGIQVVEHLLTKCEALSSNPNTAKKKKNIVFYGTNLGNTLGSSTSSHPLPNLTVF